MKIDFRRVLQDLHNQPIAHEGAPLTLRRAAVLCLMNNYPSDANIDGEEKLRRFSLATKIHSSEDVLDIPLDDVAYLKTLANRFFGTLVYARIVEAFEGDPA